MDNNISQNLSQSYSSIIAAQDYNDIMTREHLYIDTSDRFISNVIEEKASIEKLNIVELGCGPARLTRLIAKISNIKLTGVDIDPAFCQYARELSDKHDLNLHIVNSDVTSYMNSEKVDIFYSQGFHHHVAKGEDVCKYLLNIYNQLSQGGYYIVSDEFVPNYIDENDRDIKLVIWYSHVISHALRNKYDFLAAEEAETLLDDLQEGASKKGLKTQAQIELVLSYVEKIDIEAKARNLTAADRISKEFLIILDKLFNVDPNRVDDSMNLSRQDYKICDSVFIEEIKQAGFTVESKRSFGPIETIGGMSVYILRK